MLWGNKTGGVAHYLRWAGKSSVIFAAFESEGSEGEGALNPGRVRKVVPKGVCWVWDSLEEARDAQSRVSKVKQGQGWELMLEEEGGWKADKGLGASCSSK